MSESSISYHRQFLCGLLSALLALSSVLLPTVQAQSGSLDLTPPVINYDPVRSGGAGELQVFTAEVLEDRVLLSVVLYHRFAGDVSYASSEMLSSGDNFFSATVVTESTDVRDIEYYIEAEDADGNRTIRGFSFDPLVRQITSDTGGAIAATAAASSTAAGDATGSNSRWAWGLLGLLVVVVVAGAAGSGDSGGSGTTVAPSTVVLEVEPL